MIASASIGAVFTSASPDFGAKGLLDRFTQAAPKVLCNRWLLLWEVNGFSCLDKLDEVVQGYQPSSKPLSSLTATKSIRMKKYRVVPLILWSDFLQPYNPKEVEFPPHGFNHPWYILYSSGTTGKPKCIVHRSGGSL